MLEEKEYSAGCHQPLHSIAHSATQRMQTRTCSGMHAVVPVVGKGCVENSERMGKTFPVLWGRLYRVQYETLSSG